MLNQPRASVRAYDARWHIVAVRARNKKKTILEDENGLETQSFGKSMAKSGRCDFSAVERQIGSIYHIT